VYGWLWRKLPGRWPLKMLESVTLVLVLSVVLVVLVFPWIEPKLPFSDNTVDGGNDKAVSTPAATPTSTIPGSSSVTSTPQPSAADSVLPGD